MGIKISDKQRIVKPKEGAEWNFFKGGQVEQKI
jgi:hypothetical protein